MIERVRGNSRRLDPPEHGRLRALIAGAFSRRAITDLAPRIRAISAELLAPHLARGELDLVADYAVLLPLRVIADVLGAPPGDLARFRARSDVVLGLIHFVSGDPRADDAARAFAEATSAMRGYLAALIEERRRAPRDDLLTHLAESRVDGDALAFEELR
ncbi:MAG TPA: hypothetical protein VGI39_13685 [Polyangiaceae bacterium]|jgi:cytochrome P450